MCGGGFGQQGRRAAEDDARAEPREQQGIGAGDAAVKDVSADGDGDAFERFRRTLMGPGFSRR